MNISIAFHSFKKFSLLIGLAATGCSDFVEGNLPNYEITSKTVFQDDETAKAVMIGLYIEIAKQPAFTNAALPILTGLSADELTTSLPYYLQYHENELTPDNEHLLPDVWKPAYRYIYIANSILEGVNHPTSVVHNKLRNQLEGEAKFIRAYCYFHLTNVFGNIPLVVSTDMETNEAIARSNVDKVYELILSDLSAARELLPTVYPINEGQEERITLTSWAALGLQSRVYLFQGEWANANAAASLVLENKASFQLQVDLRNVFSHQSKEAIWQLQSINPGIGTWEATLFIPPFGVPGFLISDQLLNSFESGDNRRHAWIDSLDNGTSKPYYFPHKYTMPYSKEEYHVELRLAHVILDRAEARAHLNDYEGSIDDINLIRERAGLIPISKNNITYDKLIGSIRQERKIEFLTEGIRWYDLKRWNLVTDVLAHAEGKQWQSTDVLYPVPQSEINKNTNLHPQNDGY